jgi:hypothetical protein
MQERYRGISNPFACRQSELTGRPHAANGVADRVPIFAAQPRRPGIERNKERKRKGKI